MKYELLIYGDPVLTVTLHTGRMTQELALKIINAERKKLKCKPLKSEDEVGFLEILED